MLNWKMLTEVIQLTIQDQKFKIDALVSCLYWFIKVIELLYSSQSLFSDFGKGVREQASSPQLSSTCTPVGYFDTLSGTASFTGVDTSQ